MDGRLQSLLDRYRDGVGLRPNDVLQPREGARPCAHGVIDSQVVVLKQSALAPHRYTVVGERENPRSPSERFVKFEIDGHDWEKGYSDLGVELEP